MTHTVPGMVPEAICLLENAGLYARGSAPARPPPESPMRKAFRAVIEVITDFEEPSEDTIRTRLERASLGFDSKVLVRQVETIEPPTDAPPFKDREVKCYSCQQPKPRSTSKPWCPSPEVGTMYTCKECEETCPMTSGATPVERLRENSLRPKAPSARALRATPPSARLEIAALRRVLLA